MQILKVKNASIFYGNVKAVQNVNFCIEKGEYVCIIGANGSGKSTLLKGIMGLTSLTDGEIKFAVLPSEISYLPQITMAEKNFPVTVWEIVLSGTQKKAKRFPFYSISDKNNAKKAIELLELSKLTSKQVDKLSGGQQQRVMLARALCRKPQVLILDEPCAGLDPEISAELYNLLLKLNKDMGITILMASHDLKEVEKYASRVIVMNKTVEYDGDIEGWKKHIYTGGY